MYIGMFSEQYNYGCEKLSRGGGGRGALARRLTVYFTQLIRSQAIAN